MPKPEGVRLRHELAAFKNVQVLLAMAMTVLGFGGVFAAITYIAPMMTEVAGFADSSVTWLLVLFGLGMVGGNLVGGKFADRALMPMLYVALGALAVVLALFTLTAHDKPLSAVTIRPDRRAGLRHRAAAAEAGPRPGAGAPTLASAVNIGAFNLGNALSAWLGGLVIAAGSATPPPTGSVPPWPPPRWCWPWSPAAWSCAPPPASRPPDSRRPPEGHRPTSRRRTPSASSPDTSRISPLPVRKDTPS